MPLLLEDLATYDRPTKIGAFTFLEDVSWGDSIAPRQFGPLGGEETPEEVLSNAPTGGGSETV
jgi:hypothetical protein